MNWEDGLVWPDLKDGGQFQIQYQIPRRANIYDREGKGLAVDGKIVTIGVVPGEMQDEAALLAGLSPILNLSPDDLKAKYASAAADWFVPLGDMPFEVSAVQCRVAEIAGHSTARKRAAGVQGTCAPCHRLHRADHRR